MYLVNPAITAIAKYIEFEIFNIKNDSYREANEIAWWGCAT